MRSIFISVILLSTAAYPLCAQAQVNAQPSNSVIDAYSKGVQARQAQERIDNENKQKADALAQQQKQFELELAQRQREFELKQQGQKPTTATDTGKNSSYPYINLAEVTALGASSTDVGKTSSYYLSANALMKDCSAGIALEEHRLIGDDKTIAIGTADASRCSGYVSAVVDLNEVGGGTLFCAPKQSSMDQLTRIFVKYVADNPGELHLSPISMLTAALGKAFPCKK
jgi:primosomal protein N'